MELKGYIREYLQQAKLMQLATSVGDQSWRCTVWFAFDEGFNLYWISKKTRRHSREIKQSPNVAGVIVQPHKPKDEVRGLQFEGKAQLVEDPQAVDKAFELYQGRIMSQDKLRAVLAKDQDEPHYFYQINVSRFVLFDEANYPDDPRQEYIFSVKKPPSSQGI